MTNLDLIARAIAIQEGFMSSGGVLRQGARPVRDNNPGDLEASSFATSKDGVYSVFPSVQAGWAGLYRQIGLYRDRGLTLAQVVAIYAPANENNTAAYLAAVVARTGLSADTRLSDVIPRFDVNNPPLPPELPGVGSAEAVDTISSQALELPGVPFDGAAFVTAVMNGPSLEIGLGVLAAGFLYLMARS